MNTAEQTQVARDDLLRVFFAAEHNDAWPDMSDDPQWAKWKDRVEPFIMMARRGDDLPIVLPRLRPVTGEYSLYVIVTDRADIMRTIDLLTAFAGPTLLPQEADLRPARLRPDDPVDRAIMAYAGSGATFILRSGPRTNQRPLTNALTLMQRTLAARPARLWRMTKPTGRLLAEFDAALASGGVDASAALLEQLTSNGGLDAANLHYLRIKRLSKLGRNAQILSMPRLGDIVRQYPPAPVRDAILDSLYFTAVERALADGDLAGAADALLTEGQHIPDLLTGDLSTRSTGTVIIAVLVAMLRIGVAEQAGRTELATIVSALRATGRLTDLPDVVLTEALAKLGVTEPEPELEPARAQPIESWPELITAIAADSPEYRVALSEATWRTWPSPAQQDAEIAESLNHLGETATAAAWALAGPFIESVGYADPAGHTARAFLDNALIFERFGPGDLASIQALLDITLRAAPPDDVYAKLLVDLGAVSNRWVALERAETVLDMVDTLVLAACPDPNARLTLALTLLAPLVRHATRLDTASREFARVLTDELALGLTWPDPQTATGATEEQTALRSAQASVLIYSLNENALARVTNQLSDMAPAVTISTSSAHVGTSQLRQHARHADIVVLATGCAKHAATGFITGNTTAKIHYAQGSGSASLLRATINALT